MTRHQLLCAGLLVLAASAASPATAQDDNFPSWNPREKFAWALRHFSEYCTVTTNRRITFEELPGWMQTGLVAASKADVIQGIQQNCPAIQSAVAQYQ